MASRRDQLQSYQFRTQRVISAVVMREADPAATPLRRGIGAIVSGLMIAIFVGVGFGVYGLLTQQGSTAWKADQAVVIEKETGASFVYQGGVLHPMLNYTSALLATDPSKRAVYREPASALSTVARGSVLGIAGAPDALPDAAQAASGPWSLCATAGTGPGGAAPATTLAVASLPRGGTPLGDQGLLASDIDSGMTYLVWHGTRDSIAASLVTALFGAVTPMPATGAWLAGLPAGPDIAPFAITGRGTPSAAAAPYAVGDVLATPVATGGQQYWLVLSGGLAPITELQKDIAIEQGFPGPTTIDVARATAIGRASLPGDAGGSLPATPPRLATASGQVCAVFSGSGAPAIRTASAGVPDGMPTGSTAPGLADDVVVPPGRYALVRTSAGYDLVTDIGVRYAIASDDVLASLGYLPSNATTVPAGLLNAIPAGPALDPDAAGRSVIAGSGASPGGPISPPSAGG